MRGVVVTVMCLSSMLSAMNREECIKRFEEFKVLERAYDAVIAADIAFPIAETVITDFRREGEALYVGCKNKISTSTWYMLGKKVRTRKKNIRDFHLESPQELVIFARSHPPVVTRVLCGSVTNGGASIQPAPRLGR